MTHNFDIFMIQEATSGINEMNQKSEEKATIYDLIHRQVVNPTQGIYIKAGKKALIY